MFEQYSFKIKFKALIVIFIMLSIAAYRRSFSTLIESVRENKLLSEKMDAVKSKTRNSNQLIAEVAALDKMIGKKGLDNERIQQEIVGFLLKHNKNVAIDNLQPIHEFEDENYKVSTYQIDLIGNFNDLIGLTYQFEKDFDYSKLVSVKYYVNKKNNKKEVLHLNLIFQKYESNK